MMKRRQILLVKMLGWRIVNEKDTPSEGSHMAPEECDNNDGIPKDNFLSQQGHIPDESVHMKEPQSPRNVKVKVN